MHGLFSHKNDRMSPQIFYVKYISYWLTIDSDYAIEAAIVYGTLEMTMYQFINKPGMKI